MNRDVIANNRKYLGSVTQWISEEDYSASLNHYGCPSRLYSFLNRPINNEPTYTDLLAFAAKQLKAPVSYLELGVAVGKNLYVLANALEQASLAGFDWERINPSIEKHFLYQGEEGPLRYYRHGGNKIAYLQGNVLNQASWRWLQGRRFNLIFSDASHHTTALLFECEMLRRFDMLATEQFMMVWDDLDRSPTGPLTQAFYRICGEMRDAYAVSADQMFLFELNGWFGQYEHKHVVGIINNLGITKELLQGLNRD